MFKPREFDDREPVQDVLLVPGETEHDRICRYHYDNNDHHIFLNKDDDMQHENPCHHTRHPRRHLARQARLNYFLAGSAAFAVTGAAGA